MSLIRRVAQGLFAMKSSKSADVAEVLDLDQFEGPVYAVGDVHGCHDLYVDIEAKILDNAKAFDAPATIILLGDVVDRGPQSAAMIDHLLRPLPGDTRRVCLMGNHEAMMLDFLAAPSTDADWLHLGGFETLASYGLTFDQRTLQRLPSRKLQQALAAHLPEQHIRFLRHLPLAIRAGPYLLAHAGASATAPLSAQPRQALLWGSEGRVPPAGLTLIHGHYVTHAPDVRKTSIGIDTGAYATGRLTALRLSHGQRPAALSRQRGPSNDKNSFHELKPQTPAVAVTQSR